MTYLNKGVIEEVSRSKSFQTRRGPKCNVNLKIQGVVYTIPFRDPNAPEDKLPKVGQEISFSFQEKQNGDYLNREVDVKTLELGAVVASPTPGSGSRSSGVDGVVIGHAITNAVNMVLASGNVDPSVALFEVAHVAKDIIRLSHQLKEQGVEAIINEVEPSVLGGGEKEKTEVAPERQQAVEQFDDDIGF